MDIKEFKQLLEDFPNYFVQFQGEANWRDGWKLSIQGETIEDSLFLFDALIGFLVTSKCSYKFATKKLIESGIPQQEHKLLTIYIPNGVDVKSFAELVHLNMSEYKGGKNVTPPTMYEHYKNAIYFRNDRDENGEYVNPRK